jgi:precorrin-6B methylase 2
MMGAAIADRIRWAVDVLAVSPSDRLLEIGCGNGAAVASICRALTDGSITAIDRSDTMIRIALSPVPGVCVVAGIESGNGRECE